MSGSARVQSSSRRPPLNPLIAGQHQNSMKASDTSPPRLPSSNTTQQAITKRHSPEISGDAESENAPLSLHSKRQRTKSGSDAMDLLACQDPSAIPPTDCCAKEPMPLCEHNVRTARPEAGSDVNMEPSCSCSKWDSSSSSDSASGDAARSDCARECSADCSSSKLTDNSIGPFSDHRPIANGVGNGGLSPHCAATLEYVTQLPEGCSGGGANSNLDPTTLNGASEADEELEDDDNYLDSSEEEEEDDLALTNNEEDESCGEGKIFI